MTVGGRAGEWDRHGRLDTLSFYALRRVQIGIELRHGAGEEVLVAAPAGLLTPKTSTRGSNDDSGCHRNWTVCSFRLDIGPFKGY